MHQPSKLAMRVRFPSPAPRPTKESLMRRSILALSIAITALSLPVLASGVLLPSNDTQEGSGPSLGLVPRARTQVKEPKQPIPTSKIITEQPELSIPILNTTQSYSTDFAPSKNTIPNVPTQKALETVVHKKPEMAQFLKPELPITPGGYIASDVKKKALIIERNTSGRGRAQPQHRNPVVAKALKKALARKDEIERSSRINSTIINEIMVPSPIEGKNRITIGIAKNYHWSLQDVLTIQSAFGYNVNVIPQKCQLRMEATIDTNASPAFFKGTVLGGTKTALKYSGNIKSVTMQAMALCQPPRSLPRSGTIIMQAGNLYSIMLLGSKNCKNTSDSKTPNSLLINYHGNKKIKCTFE